MKTLSFSILLLVISLFTSAQTENKIVIGKIDSVYSSILNEERKVWVYIPNADTENGIYAQQRYPVVYLLDGDAHFYSVVGMIQQLSQVNGNTICPEMIVVGIPNTDRTRDLTPTHIESDPPFMDSTFSVTTGGGENFISFIEKELAPHIDSMFPTSPYKMLIGHSFGGLAVMHSLINHPGLFNAYVCIDPSMWYDKMNFLKETQKALANKKYDGVSLYLGYANTMEDGMNVRHVISDTSQSTAHIRSIIQLDRSLKENTKNGLRYQGNYYENDDHGSVPLIAEYDALRFIFDFYRLKLSFEDWTDSTARLANKHETHFKNISRHLGYKVSPSENMMNTFGYEALNSKLYVKAESFFKLNVANYPESYNVYDSYGDFFVAKGDTANAVANFEKALALKENPFSRQKLNELQGVTPLMLSVIELQQYAGEFDFTGMVVKTYITEDKVMMFAPGQPEYELVPAGEHEFSIRNLSGYKVRFEMEDGKPIAMYSIQPEGTFKATTVNQKQK